jgi:hypothetical protein
METSPALRRTDLAIIEEPMAAEGLGPVIGPAVVLMGAAVIAVPLFRRLGLGVCTGVFRCRDSGRTIGAGAVHRP